MSDCARRWMLDFVLPAPSPSAVRGAYVHRVVEEAYMARTKLNARHKADAEEIHARKRSFERYGLSLTADDYRGLVNQIRRQPHKARFIVRMTNRVTIWIVTYHGTYDTVPMLCAYDNRRQRIITFLPKTDPRWP